MRTRIGRMGLRAMVISAAFASLTGSAQEWWVEGGPLFRGGMRMQVGGTSYVQAYGIHAVEAPLSVPASVGSARGYADRVYDNGYVKVDAGTLNPDGVGGTGNTWNWAYDNAEQYNAAKQTLSFSRLGAEGYSPEQMGALSSSEDLSGAGLQLQVGRAVFTSESGKWQLDLAVGFEGLWGAESSYEGSSYQERIQRIEVRDTYNVAGAVDPVYGFALPRTVAGGYVGTYGGPADGPSAWVGGYPTIYAQPSSRVAALQQAGMARNYVSFHAEASLYQLTLNPRLRYKPSDTFNVHVTPKIGVGYQDLSVGRTEEFQVGGEGSWSTILSWRDQKNESAFHAVAGVVVGADLDLGKGFYAGIFGGYEWVLSETRVTIGPNTVSMDGSGFVAGASFGKNF